MSRQPLADNPLPPEVLSEQDRALITLVASGMPDREIARRLMLSEGQVRTLLLRLFRKLAVAGLLDQLLYRGGARQKPVLAKAASGPSD